MSTARKKKVWKYSAQFLKFGSIPSAHDESSPLCLLCQHTLTNESMKAGHLENHLKAKQPDCVKSNLQYSIYFKDKFENRTTITSLFANQNASLNRALKASYEISLLIAKMEKSYDWGTAFKTSNISFCEKFHKKMTKMYTQCHLVTVQSVEESMGWGKMLSNNLSRS